MRRIYLILLILICCPFIRLKAQDSTIFKIKYLPEHSYKSNITTNMNMQVDISGSEAEIDKIRARGISLPLVMTTETDIDADIKTGALNTDHAFPITFKYNNITSRQVLNDEEQPDKPNPMIGQTIYGKCNRDGKIQVDSIPGKGINDQLRTELGSVIGNLSKQVQFPERPLKIGETFTQEAPISLPIAGLNMQFAVKIAYKLTKIENSLAYFDLDESMDLNMSGKKGSVNMTASGMGAGKGSLSYNIDQNYLAILNTNLDFKIKMLVGDLTMNCTAKMSSINKTEIVTDAK